MVMAKDFGATVEIHDCLENYGNIHDVPEQVLETMKRRWVTLTDEIKALLIAGDEMELFSYMTEQKSNIKKA